MKVEWLTRLFFLPLFILLNCVAMTAQADDADLATALGGLKEKSFSKKLQTLDHLETIDDPRVLKVFTSMLAGDLYSLEAQPHTLVLTQKAEDGLALTDVLTGESLGVMSKRDLDKVKVNNALRIKLRSAISKLSLNNKDPYVRRDAVRNMFRDIDSDSVALFRERMVLEQDERVLEALAVGVALYEVKSNDAALRLAAVEVLGDSLESEARNILLPMVEKNEDGSYVVQERALRVAAIKALSRIDAKLKYNDWAETIYFGLSLGSVLLLAAIGLAITFGVMGVINMAHGELIMIGAYTTYVVQLLMPNSIEYSLFVAVPTAFVVAGLVGVAIERGVIRFLYGRPLETLLATFGISLILQQLVRSVFSPLNRSVETPQWMSGTFEINSALSLTYNRAYIIVFSLMVFSALLMVLKKTSLGLHVRAVSQNRTMARAMGVRTGWVDAMTFGLGSGIAGIAGVALSQLTNVGPNMGQAYIIDSFMVVVFGGVGNLWGTLVAAMSLGVINKVLEPWAGAVLAKILVLVFIILFIQKRPKGLFPQRGRSAD